MIRICLGIICFHWFFFHPLSALSLSLPRTSALSLPPAAALGCPAPPSTSSSSHHIPGTSLSLTLPLPRGFCCLFGSRSRSSSLSLSLACAPIAWFWFCSRLFTSLLSGIRPGTRGSVPPAPAPALRGEGAGDPCWVLGCVGARACRTHTPQPLRGPPAPAQPSCVRRCSVHTAGWLRRGDWGWGLPSATCSIQGPVPLGDARRHLSVCLSVPPVAPLSQQGARGWHRWLQERVGLPWRCPWALGLLQGDAHLVWWGRLRKPPPAAWAEAGELLCPARPEHGHLAGPRGAERLLRDLPPPQGSCREGRVQGGRCGAVEGFLQQP